MFVLVRYFQLSFNYIISHIFQLGSTRFQLDINYVCRLCIRQAHDVCHFYPLFSCHFSNFQSVFFVKLPYS
jgi:hypothetical protein